MDDNNPNYNMTGARKRGVWEQPSSTERAVAERKLRSRIESKLRLTQLITDKTRGSLLPGQLDCQY